MSSLHQRAKDLFLQALRVPMRDREAFVADACGTDARLRQEVESLLAFHEETDGGRPTPAPGPDTAATGFAAGEIFAGRHRMIARLGRGGMGEVWRAWDGRLKRPVAVKHVLP